MVLWRRKSKVWVGRMVHLDYPFLDSKILIWLCVGLGIAFRLKVYLDNRSLWLDEARLSLNIVNKSIPQLFGSLDYEQGAPVGFLVVEKLITQLFGNSEYALRLFPFLSGTISLILFYYFACHFLNGKAPLMALALFVVSPYLIYYSAEVKQYSSDVLIMLLLYSITFYFQSNRLTLGKTVIFGLVGGIALWFSHPAVFVLAGIGVCLLWFIYRDRDWQKLRLLLIAYSMWAASLVSLYIVSLRQLSHNAGLLNYWGKGFMPLLPHTAADVRWFMVTFWAIFDNPGGFELVGLAAFAALNGVLWMTLAQREQFLLLVFPVGFTLVASGLYLYPFRGRLLLFIVPAIIVIVAAGIEQLRLNTTSSYLPIAALFLSLLLFHPLLMVVHTLFNPASKEEIRPVMDYIHRHQKDEDIIYLYYGAEEAFTFYQDRYGFQNGNYIVGVYSRDNLAGYAHDLDQLRDYKRVWILFSHLYSEDDEQA
ncbi:MAG: glycosyltransferase family 39 protein, partial [Anaerolineae bacterium]|nr:glycosyltransferase family 39 protein [Anaerolineae bacterium]